MQPNEVYLTKTFHFVGHYKALEWNEEKNIYEENDKLGIQVDVEVRPFAYQRKRSHKLRIGLTGSRFRAYCHEITRALRESIYVHIS